MVYNPYYESAKVIDKGWTRGREHRPATIPGRHDLHCAMGAIKAVTQQATGLSVKDLPEPLVVEARGNSYTMTLLRFIEEGLLDHKVDELMAQIYINFGDRWVRENTLFKIGRHGSMMLFNDQIAGKAKDVSDMLRQIGDAWEQTYGTWTAPLTRRQRIWARIDKAFSGLPKVPVDLPVIEVPAIREARLRDEEMARLEEVAFWDDFTKLTPQTVDLSFLDKGLVNV